ncbi:MAG: ABC transporter substrate-binding protein, partial [Thermaceae bacterium]
VEATHYLPFRKNAEAELKDPMRKTVFAQIEVARPWSQDPEMVLWYGFLEEALEKSLKQGVLPLKALEEAQKRALAVESR